MPTSIEPARRRAPAGRPGILPAALLIALLPGCGPPQVSGEHRELVLRLATGSSTQDPGILGRAAEEVDRLSSTGELSGAQEAAFRSILDAADDGDWDRARRLSYALRDAQRPTEEDRKRVADRTLPGMKPFGPAPPGQPTDRP